MIKKKNSLFLLRFIFLGMIFNIRPEDQQNVFNDAQNIPVKRFISSRAGNIQKEPSNLTGQQKLENDISKAPKTTLTSHEIYEQILKTCVPNDSSSLLSLNAFTDLDFVREDGNDIVSIFTKFIGTQTKSGEVVMFLTTLYPTSDIEILKTRQKFIQALESDPVLLQEIDNIITEIKIIENNLYSAFFENAIDSELKNIKSRFAKVNGNSNLWNLLSIFEIGAMGSTICLDFFARSYYLYENSLFKKTDFVDQYVWGSMLGSTLGNLIALDKLSLRYNSLVDSIKKAQEKLISFAATLSEVEKLHNLLKKNNLLTEEFKKAIPALNSLEQFINDPELNTIKKLLHKNTFKGNASVLSNWGNTAVAIQALTEDIRKKFVPLVSVFGSMDMYSAIAKLMKSQKESAYVKTSADRENKQRFCYAEYVEKSDHPVLELKNVWNPLILTHKSIENVITNNVNFDQNSHLMVVTGPNTCGKTIITTSYVVAALFAQTLGIIPASSCTLTPFDSLYVLLTIRSDGSVGDSRFNAELREMKMLIDSLEKMKKDNIFSLVLIDEPFTGTNPKDGEYALSTFVKRMIEGMSLDNAIMMIATHYHELTSMAEKNKMVVNYQVQAKRNEDGTLTRFFKLIPGISHLSVVKDLLKIAGF